MNFDSFRTRRGASSALAALLAATEGKVDDRRYAGVGARKTPPEVLELMTRIAAALAIAGMRAATGDAVGADHAFRTGDPRAEVFTTQDATETTIAIAKEVHPTPYALSDSGVLLMARNTNQVFGKALDQRVSFVLCWTPDGCESFTTRSRQTGGTGQAIALASHANIPVFNLKNRDAFDRLLAHVSKFNPQAAAALRFS